MECWLIYVYRFTDLNAMTQIMSPAIYNADWDVDKYMFTDLRIWMLQRKIIRFMNLTANDGCIVVYFHSRVCNDDSL